MSQPMMRQVYFNSYTGAWDEYWVPVAPVPVYYPPVVQPQPRRGSAAFWTFTLLGVVFAIVCAARGAAAGALICLLGGLALGGWVVLARRHPVAAGVVLGAMTTYTALHHQYPDGSVDSAAHLYAQQQVYGPR